MIGSYGGGESSARMGAFCDASVCVPLGAPCRIAANAPAIICSVDLEIRTLQSGGCSGTHGSGLSTRSIAAYGKVLFVWLRWL